MSDEDRTAKFVGEMEDVFRAYHKNAIKDGITNQQFAMEATFVASCLLADMALIIWGDALDNGKLANVAELVRRTLLSVSPEGIKESLEGDDEDEIKTRTLN